MQLFYDSGRRTRRAEKAVPDARLVAWHACFGDRGYVGQARGALEASHSQRPQFACSDVRQQTDLRSDDDLSMTRNDVGDRRATPLERDMDEIDFRHELEELGVHV